jgi:hypothetical protein
MSDASLNMRTASPGSRSREAARRRTNVKCPCHHVKGVFHKMAPRRTPAVPSPTSPCRRTVASAPPALAGLNRCHCGFSLRQPPRCR